MKHTNGQRSSKGARLRTVVTTTSFLKKCRILVLTRNICGLSVPKGLETRSGVRFVLQPLAGLIDRVTAFKTATAMALHARPNPATFPVGLARSFQTHRASLVPLC